MNYIGMDVHKRFTYAVVKDEQGNDLAKERFDNNKANFESFLKPFAPEKTRVVMESTGVWEYVYGILEQIGYSAKLANPAKTKAIAYAKVKTDAVDASTLADLLRANLVAESYVPTKEIRNLREIVRLRKMALKQSNQSINRLHALLTRKGIFLPKKSLCKTSINFLLKEIEKQPAIKGYLEVIDFHKKKLAEINAQIIELAEKDAQAQLLMTIPGISGIRAITLIAEIGDISRFPAADKLCSYAGLVSSVHQSGSTLYFGRLMQQASKALKHVMIQTAWTNIRLLESNPIKEHYKKLEQKKGKQKAICAATRKLCTVVYAVLRNKEKCRYS
ncbi:IS110 family transposase [Candidatus Pacearchaeota archaeon]|nr:IS110 family transposase [Candidatus Pacearchaeota archaeon]